MALKTLCIPKVDQTVVVEAHLGASRTLLFKIDLLTRDAEPNWQIVGEGTLSFLSDPILPFSIM